MVINPTIAGGTTTKKPVYDASKEIERTNQVIADRTKQGLDVSSQMAHYKNLTGKSYVAPKAQGPQAPNMNQSIQDMFGQSQTYLNNMFNQQKESQLSALNAQRDQALGKINQQKSQVAPQYQGMRNQTDAMNQQNVQKLREMMAANGLSASGENVTATVAMNNERVNSINKLNLQEQETLNDFERQIADINNPAEEQALISALESQRSQALYDAYNRANDVGYNRYRDGVADQRYEKEFQYGAFRDRVGDARYADETKYNRGQDQRQWNYQVGRDQVADAQWYQQFNEDVKRYGQDYALKSYAQSAGLSMEQARLQLSQQEFGLSQDKFAFDQQQSQLAAQQQPSADLSKFTGQLNKTYLTKDLDGNYVLDPKKEDGLIKSIIGLNLSDADTDRLLSMYGLMGKVEGFLQP